MGRALLFRVSGLCRRARGDVVFRRRGEDVHRVRVRVVRILSSFVFAKIYIGFALSHARERDSGEEERVF